MKLTAEQVIQAVKNEKSGVNLHHKVFNCTHIKQKPAVNGLEFFTSTTINESYNARVYTKEKSL